MSVEALDDSDRDFLAALARGETARAYAQRAGYSAAWARLKARRIKDRLGAATLGEAVAMSEGAAVEGVSRADFDKLTSLVARLGDSLEELAKARPHEQAAAREQVREREWDLKDHAKALGLSLDDVKKLQEEKEYDRFRTMQERLERERAETADEDGQDGDGNRSLGEQIRDGLGGIRNVRP